MISTKHRFHGHNSLRFVYERGKTVRSQMLSLKFAKNQRRTEYRAAVVVSRKVHKSAVKRNRIRRRIYEIVRVHAPLSESPIDMVFTVFSDQIAELEHDKLEEMVTGLIQKANADVPPPKAGPSHVIVKPKGRSD